MKKNYDFHPDLREFEKMKPPVIPAIIPGLQKLMGMLYNFEKSDGSVSVSTFKVPAKDGAKLRVLRYEPKDSVQNPPCLLFFHGGGFVYNASPHHFRLARTFAEMAGCTTLLADYRLAPGYKFPTAAEDCFVVYRWVLGHADEVGIDPNRITVCGDSAGGNLASAVCLMARDYRIPIPIAQMLLYPVTDRRMKTESMQKYTDTPMCKRGDMEKYFQMYLPTDDIPAYMIPYVSPIEAKCLEGMPDTYIEVAEFDCLHDEGVELAHRLADEGVEVELHETSGTIHGYDIAGNCSLMREYMGLRLHFLKRVNLVQNDRSG